MSKVKKIRSRGVRLYSNSLGYNEFSREAYVSQVLKIIQMKYNLEERDIEKYVLGRKKHNEKTI